MAAKVSGDGKAKGGLCDVLFVRGDVREVAIEGSTKGSAKRYAKGFNRKMKELGGDWRAEVVPHTANVLPIALSPENNSDSPKCETVNNKADL